VSQVPFIDLDIKEDLALDLENRLLVNVHDIHHVIQRSYGCEVHDKDGRVWYSTVDYDTVRSMIRNVLLSKE
jgi:hypothetical protein